jgi:hypothetical protein
MKKYLLILLLFVFALSTLTLLAQTPADVNNPTSVEFVASVDHALIDSYELDILRPDGSVLQTLNLGKGVPAPTTGVISAPINVQPVAFAVGYTVRIRAKAGSALSENAVSVNKFNRVPGKPSGLVVK